VGRFTCGPKASLWVHWSWFITQSIAAAYNPLDPDNSYDVYVSLKVQGPAYVDGATEENAIFLDRIILVKCDGAVKREN